MKTLRTTLFIFVLLASGCSKLIYNGQFSAEDRRLAIKAAIEVVEGAQDRNELFSELYAGESRLLQDLFKNGFATYPELDALKDLKSHLSDEEKEAANNIGLLDPPAAPENPDEMGDFDDFLANANQFLGQVGGNVPGGGGGGCIQWQLFGGNGCPWVNVCVKPMDGSVPCWMYAEIKQCYLDQGLTCTNCGQGVANVADWILPAHTNLCQNTPTIQCTNGAGQVVNIPTGSCS